jgi:RNA polymerase sigma-70 factor, ECF subfamily
MTVMDADAALAEAWRTSWSRLVGLLIGQYQRPDLAEDAVGDAFEAAARHWPDDGVPTNPGAWLLTAARRRVLDRLRTESVHRRKEPLMVVDDEMRAAAAAATSLDDEGAHIADEQLRLVFACCHPALAADDRVALTLRFVVGLTTAEIARLLLVQETAMAARLTRAKKRLASSGIPFAVPSADQLATRLDVVATVFYLMFTSGYQPGSGAVTLRVDLADEAIRMVRQLRALLPSADVLSSLLALLLLQHSRRDARLSSSGDLVLLPEQDRSLWHTDEIEEALSLLAAAPSPRAPSVPDAISPAPNWAGDASTHTRAEAANPTPNPVRDASTSTPNWAGDAPATLGRLAEEYRLQALVAAEHATASSSAATRWTRICTLYAELEDLTGSPVVRLARAVAVAEASGPAAGLRLLEGLDDALPRHHRLPAVRAELLVRAGDPRAAAAQYERALSLVTSEAERTHLTTRLASLPL